MKKPNLKVAVAAVLTVALGVSLAACSSTSGEDAAEAPPEPQLGYVLPQPIATLNAGTNLGVATEAVKVSSRLFPGAYIAGRDGRLLPNADLVTATRNPEHPERIDYLINDQASYSDGVAIGCEDFSLAWIAAQRPDLFGSDMPLFEQVENIECAPGQKGFAVIFKPGFGDRYQELFTAGTVLPSHTIAKEAGVPDVFASAHSGDEEALAAVGRAWQELFDVTDNDPSNVPTSGPYTVKKRGKSGELVLEANPKWHAVEPELSPIYLWPNTAKIKQLAQDDQVVVADLDIDVDPEKIGLKAPQFVVEHTSSTRVDTLSIAPGSVLATPEARRAFGACIDRGRLVATMSQHTAAEVLGTGLRVVPPSHPLAHQLAPTNEHNSIVDPELTRGTLDGAVVRIGYLESNSRYELLVNEIKDMCGFAGVTVEPVPVSEEHYGVLGVDYDVLLDTRAAFGRNAATNANINSKLREIREAEETLAGESWTIPLLTEPRTLAVEEHMRNVVDSGNDGGASWNMDRWIASSESIHDEVADENHENQGSEQPTPPPAPAGSPA